MAIFKIEQPGKPVKWIKDIDRENHTLEFTEDSAQAYDRDGCFYPKAELGYIKFHFGEQYPEVEYCTIDGEY